MEKRKVKELKDDAILDIKVNKTFYLMSKAALLLALKESYDSSVGDSETFIKNTVSKKYEEMNDKERSFYTLTLLVGEIEKQAIENNAFIEKEIDPEQMKQDLQKAEESNKD